MRLVLFSAASPGARMKLPGDFRFDCCPPASRDKVSAAQSATILAASLCVSLVIEKSEL
jgi:hypothetical protein